MHTLASMKALVAVSVRLIISEKYGMPSPSGMGNCDAGISSPGARCILEAYAPYFSEIVTENRYED